MEGKAIEVLVDVRFEQVPTPLKLSDRRLGILVNFNVARLNGNVRRIVNNLA